MLDDFPATHDPTQWQAVAELINRGLSTAPSSTVQIPTLPFASKSPHHSDSKISTNEILLRNTPETIQATLVWLQSREWPQVSSEAAACVRVMLLTISDFVESLIVGPPSRLSSLFPFPAKSPEHAAAWLLVDWWTTTGYLKAVFAAAQSGPRFGASDS